MVIFYIIHTVNKPMKRLKPTMVNDETNTKKFLKRVFYLRLLQEI